MSFSVVQHCFQSSQTVHFTTTCFGFCFHSGHGIVGFFLPRRFRRAFFLFLVFGFVQFKQAGTSSFQFVILVFRVGRHDQFSGTDIAFPKETKSFDVQVGTCLFFFRIEFFTGTHEFTARRALHTTGKHKSNLNFGLFFDTNFGQMFWVEIGRNVLV